jgi:hypothetical protein
MSAPSIEKISIEIVISNQGFWKLLILGGIELQNLLERELGLLGWDYLDGLAKPILNVVRSPQSEDLVC